VVAPDLSSDDQGAQQLFDSEKLVGWTFSLVPLFWVQLVSFMVAQNHPLTLYACLLDNSFQVDCQRVSFVNFLALLFPLKLSSLLSFGLRGFWLPLYVVQVVSVAGTLAPTQKPSRQFGLLHLSLFILPLLVSSCTLTHGKVFLGCVVPSGPLRKTAVSHLFQTHNPAPPFHYDGETRHLWAFPAHHTSTPPPNLSFPTFSFIHLLCRELIVHTPRPVVYPP